MRWEKSPLPQRLLAEPLYPYQERAGSGGILHAQQFVNFAHAIGIRWYTRCAMRTRLPKQRVQTREETLQRLREALPDLCEHYGVQRLALYGSFAHGAPHTRSDVDIIVQLERPLGLKIAALRLELEQLLGRRVDLATMNTLLRALQSPQPHKRRIAERVFVELEDVQETGYAY
jgi:predicted nucleotidyltransferase